MIGLPIEQTLRRHDEIRSHEGLTPPTRRVARVNPPSTGVSPPCSDTLGELDSLL